VKSKLAWCAALLLGLAACGNSDVEAEGPDASSDTGTPSPEGGPPPDAGFPQSGPVAMLVYPGFTALDLLGPHTVFVAMGTFQVDLVWKNLDPVTTDTGVTVKPTRTFADTPQDLAILFVPGTLLGSSVMRDQEAMDFLRSRGPKAKLVTSVCTGSIILGAAGLLRGYRATSHWAARDLLPSLGAEPVNARYVEDRNRITGAGVTAGLDFGLYVASRVEDAESAQSIQLMIEYAPDPPFNAGTPETAPESVRNSVGAFVAPFIDEARTIIAELERDR
jgi:cyclohexyl-isocyanide hydratase